MPALIPHQKLMAKYLLLRAILVIGLVAGACNATIFAVGGIAGWDASADLHSWVADKVFRIGDVLLFQYSRYHDVNEVDSLNYNRCNATDPILSASSGNTSVPLTTAGKKYFIAGDPLYCFGGMRLQVNVQGNGTSTKPAASPVSPESGQPESPPSDSRPAANNRDLSPPVVSGGRLGRRGWGFGGWLCAIGSFAWIVFKRI